MKYFYAHTHTHRHNYNYYTHKCIPHIQVYHTKFRTYNHSCTAHDVLHISVYLSQSVHTLTLPKQLTYYSLAHPTFCLFLFDVVKRMLRSFEHLYIKHHSTSQGNHPSGENPENGEESGGIPEGYIYVGMFQRSCHWVHENK